MTDNLRDRIAAVIETAIPEKGPSNFSDVADAVIREVLTPEFLADLVIQAVLKAADND